MAELTPMKRQYLAIKDQHPDCLLFFRLGDFYEMFDEDAKTAAAELNLTLTTRDRNKPPEERTPMCGVPYHSAEAYIARLIAKGYKVAICEQTEDPAQAKGLVDREIIRVVTPGTLIEENMLEEGRNNFLASLYVGVQGTGLCFGDISTGEVFLTFFAPEGWVDHAVNELARFAPREVILSPGARDKGLLDHLSGKLPCRVEQAGEERFALAEARQRVERQFAAGLDQVPPEAEAAIQAAGGLLSYLYETQKTDLSYLRTLRYYSTGRFLELDPVARRNLELTETLRGKEKKGSLLWVLDKTKTAMGGRLLRSWLERPLLDPVAISRRLEAVGWLLDNAVEREELVQVLREITDLERLISRIVYGTAGARDLVALAAGLDRLPLLQDHLPQQAPSLLARLRAQLDGLPELTGLIARGIVDEPPFSVREGGLIRPGYHPDVDQLRAILTDTKGVIAKLEAAEKEKTGIKSLKVGFNKVFGYYIEVSKSYYDQVPQGYIRKQTLTNCERYITQELKEMEHTILSAQDRLTALEYELFCDIRDTRWPPRPPDPGDRRGGGPGGCADLLCRCGGGEQLLHAPGGQLRQAGDHRRPPPGGGGHGAGRPLCPQRHLHGQQGQPGRHHHWPQHGRQVHLYAAGGPHGAHGPDGVLCPRPGGPTSGWWTDFHPHWGFRTTWRGGQSTFMVEMTEVAGCSVTPPAGACSSWMRSAGGPPPTTACPLPGRCWSGALTPSAWGPRPSLPLTTTS